MCQLITARLHAANDPKSPHFKMVHARVLLVLTAVSPTMAVPMRYEPDTSTKEAYTLILSLSVGPQTESTANVSPPPRHNPITQDVLASLFLDQTSNSTLGRKGFLPPKGMHMAAIRMSRNREIGSRFITPTLRSAKLLRRFMPLESKRSTKHGERETLQSLGSPPSLYKRAYLVLGEAS
ncbi:uncharacterized protein BDZ83DRAFT_134770 [Colletotrichum acutatum]|uniref:Uncharacterized protein n=1 Tax=Glomerella acutata TaxID=27357 RepID=A0AAD8UC25_GLOAC|nr:uncharacterized protein BDZ83DRAFT_134770 [Colletotrichum acutatum]KAK1710003.1 hypothetical protein BDZ83DRAFT_134770 [Colletotrichum acutatum]